MKPAKGVRESDLLRLEALLLRRTNKARASVSLAESLLDAADHIAGPTGRSALIERALRGYLRRYVRHYRRLRELVILNSHADELNTASDEALADQATADE